MTTTTDSVQEAVQRVWGYGSLRPMQSAAIAAGLEARDCLTVLPTGGGKSLCYQVPPLVTGKATIVLSPLIALMRDQVRGLELNGYEAAAIHSGVDVNDAKSILRRLTLGELNLLFVAPERAVNPGFKAFLASLADAGRLGSIAIDEAHCISQWGHDFRPEYCRLSELREVAPGVAMQAFTATATPRVREDICHQLGLRDPEILVGIFDRPNLTYRVRTRRDAAEQTAEAVRRHERAGDGGGTIVYCLSRKDTEQLAEQLRAEGVNAEAYHAGLNEKTRRDVEHRFTNETLDAVVATVAFGMGIDRSNVRLVVHATMPKSVEAYQQETGRAGRDGEPAECLLLYNPSDASRWERLIRMGNADMGAGDDATESQLGLVREMRRVVASMGCRHRMLSEHFGQAYNPPAGLHTCGACDVCLGETESVSDSTRVAQIILSAVARTDQRYGATHIADIVRGADTERLRTTGHNLLPVHGLLAEHRKPALLSYIDQLVSAEALNRVVDGHFETLRFGPRGVPVMKGEEEISLARPAGTGTAKTERRRRDRTVNAEPLSIEDKQLFESLRTLRKEIATDRNVPPYVVFSDSTLRELARHRPTSPSQMLEIKGIGQAKLEAFGDTFLRAVASG
ncbi:MAG: RecQ family ATP-dependent DNA helicase [Phycisphaerales bacterium]